MVFNTVAVRVMIASPSDVLAARDAVEQALHDWNQANAHCRGVVLMPWRWESSSVPLMGQAPQNVINAQGLDQADIVFVLFGTKLGTQTASALSGTVEELVRASNQGKPVHVYFSKEAVDLDSIDTEALSSLRDYKRTLNGLYREFSSASELTTSVWQAIEHDIDQLDLEPSRTELEVGKPPSVAWSVDHETAREVKSFDRKGNPKYINRHQIVVTNRGQETATGVTFHSVPEDSRMLLNDSPNPTDIYPDQSKRLSATFVFGGADPKLLISWTENGKENSEEFFVN